MALYLGSEQKSRVVLKKNIIPIVDISDPDELTSMLTSNNVGKIYRYTGETNDTYTNGDLYEVVKI